MVLRFNFCTIGKRLVNMKLLFTGNTALIDEAKQLTHEKTKEMSKYNTVKQTIVNFYAWL